MSLVFLVHVLTTLMVAGIMWFIQLVHYPLLRHVGRSSFVAYETTHTRLAIEVVVSLMVIESITAGLLLLGRPQGITLAQCWIGVLLLTIIWWSTLRLQVPQHHILASGFDEHAYRRLVGSHWIRTGSYSARALLMLWMISGAMKATP